MAGCCLAATGDVLGRGADTRIASQDIPKALARFGRTRDGEQRTAAGAGLELSITKSLIELHGRTLRIASQKGSATRAMVKLPPARRDPPAARGILS